MSVKSEARELAKLYGAIPAFTCKPGCSDCCGPVPMARPEWQQIKFSKRNAGADCMSCDFLVEGKCSVYANRPFLCRLYGATREAKMACPHGCGPAVPLTRAQTDQLVAKYHKIMGSSPAGYTADMARVLSTLSPAGTSSSSARLVESIRALTM